MNRKEALAGGGGRNGTMGSASLLLQQRRMRASVVVAAGKEGGGDEGLDLFSKHRRSLPVVPVSAEEELNNRNGPPKLGNTSVTSDKVQRRGMDDLLFGADIGKHDYDWLLTPPGTPLNSSLDVREHQQSSLGPKSTSLSRPVATAKASRFSLSLAEKTPSAKPARSSSSTRPSISSYSGHLSSNTMNTSILNTSTASITSHRPSTPTKRLSATTTTNKQTTPTSRTSSRPSTPVKTRPSSSSADKIPTSSTDKPRSLHGTRLSTATSMQHVSSDVSSSSSTIANRRLSRSSTPTQRTIGPAPTITATASTRPLNSSRPSTPTTRKTITPTTVPARSSSVGRAPAASGRSAGNSSRPSSPSPRTGIPAKRIVLPDLPHDAPPNLRTKLPDRPTSVGRTRPGSALRVRADVNSDPSAQVNSSRRQSSSPVVSRGRLPENSTKTQLQSNGHRKNPPEKQVVSHNTVMNLAKPATTTESTGFGRTISKKSLDMALRHMDIKQGIGSIRGASLFPQSIRSTAKKGYPGCMSDPVVPVSRSGTDTECGVSISDSYNGAISENDDSITTSPDRNFTKKATAPDVYESTRYDSILLKEDSKNMNWLHSIEDKSDLSPAFDHRFEPPPEPFVLR